ncbi:hypothetical protein FPOAC2_03843 [Fusarium poae]|uniref:Zinc-ribbon domain-containing protein n=1 Tax=Fusarium poae TaxID=36050 RepID=A0A1B8BA92_FUSPO|nr:hypothetical protein FPOAC1_003758 [Fusarium poae]KAG8677730.1 hypothetical protein FPOAC1_003758 [Fusarium poae]OBS29608.1 hypothetical protein FPOA_03544 [Fusarium poae]
MFGRRRRPILGAAVVVGASRAVAKHEVRKQELIATEREEEIQREVELRRRQEEEQELRTQRAVDEAMKRAALEEKATQGAAVTMSPPLPQYQASYPSMQVQTRDMGLYNSVEDAGPIIQAAPAYQLAPQTRDGNSQNAQTPRQRSGLTLQYCTQCGFRLEVMDRFCRECGTKKVQNDATG